jgi:Putative adhesin
MAISVVYHALTFSCLLRQFRIKEARMTGNRSFAFGVLILTLVLCAAPAFPREIGSFDRTLNVTGSADLDVETNSGRITVRPGTSNTVRIRGIISVSDSGDTSGAEQRAREIEANPPIHQTGNAIRVERLSDTADRHISIAYEIETPAATSLRARTGSGGQTVEGIQGPVAVTTGSGGIRISDIGDEVRADTGSGGIELDGIKGRVDANTGSGGIRASNLMAEVRARTGSGGVTIQLPANGGFDLRARTGSGRVSVNPPITMENFSADRHDVRGRIRGGGPLIDVSTGSGGVSVD